MAQVLCVARKAGIDLVRAITTGTISNLLAPSFQNNCALSIGLDSPALWIIARSEKKDLKRDVLDVGAI